MKIRGKRIGEPEPKTVVIERGNETFVFTAKAVFDETEFNELCPEPKPSHSLKHGEIRDESYQRRVEEYAKNKAFWTILTSLSATEGLEWDQVDMTKPETWPKFEDELRESGLTEGEIGYLITQVTAVNAVDAEKMAEARERFFATQVEVTPQ